MSDRDCIRLAEAIKTCERWFAHIEKQKDKARQMAQLAALARTGPDGQAEAQRRKRQLDSQPKVFDGATLEPAVKALCEHARAALKVLEEAREP